MAYASPPSELPDRLLPPLPSLEGLRPGAADPTTATLPGVPAPIPEAAPAPPAEPRAVTRHHRRTRRARAVAADGLRRARRVGGERL